MNHALNLTVQGKLKETRLLENSPGECQAAWAMTWNEPGHRRKPCEAAIFTQSRLDVHVSEECGRPARNRRGGKEGAWTAVGREGGGCDEVARTEHSSEEGG
jgi:hypothetical protein